MKDNCEAPGCEVSGPPPTTCVAWGHRLCYSHFADYFEWSDKIIDRAPTAYEWAEFIETLRSGEVAA